LQKKEKKPEKRGIPKERGILGGGNSGLIKIKTIGKRVEKPPNRIKSEVRLKKEKEKKNQTPQGGREKTQVNKKEEKTAVQCLKQDPN